MSKFQHFYALTKKNNKEIPGDPIIEEEEEPESSTPRPDGAGEDEADGEGGEDGAGK